MIRSFVPKKREERNKIKNDSVAKMVIVFTIKEINYFIVGLFYDLVCTVWYLYLT